MKTGIERIAEERNRQMAQEGWTAYHDSLHHRQELAKAAATYALPATVKSRVKFWPWSKKWWKPAGHINGRGYYDNAEERIRELEKAGALIAAEIDRIQNEYKS